MKHQFELISYALCPYVQRSVILLKYKKAEYQITYIDLNNPPSWFDAISPLGQVPVLKVDQKEVIFESAVIAELLDDLIEPRLQHLDPILRAKEKSWIEYGSSLLADQYELTQATDPRTAQTLLLEFYSDLGRLEPVLGSGPYFRGTQFSLVDAAYAPLFMRMKLLPGLYDPLELAKTPKIRAWAETLLAMPEVKDSVLPSFHADYLELLKKSGSALVRDL